MRETTGEKKKKESEMKNASVSQMVSNVQIIFQTNLNIGLVRIFLSGQGQRLTLEPERRS